MIEELVTNNLPPYKYKTSLVLIKNKWQEPLVLTDDWN